MTQTDLATIRKHVVVAAPIDRAFAVFTERFGDFKPREHNLLPEPIVETVFEPRVGGNILDRTADGGRRGVPLGADPGLRSAGPGGVQLGHQPAVAGGDRPELTSEVEVRFIAESPERTRLELEHRHIDRHGPGWEGVRQGVADEAGWPLSLARYADLVAAG
jgi:hypothetical protein